MPDVAVSLCGGLDNPDGGKELSSLLFEQSLLTFDDFVLRIRENKVKSNFKEPYFKCGKIRCIRRLR